MEINLDNFVNGVDVKENVAVWNNGKDWIIYTTLNYNKLKIDDSWEVEIISRNSNNTPFFGIARRESRLITVFNGSIMANPIVNNTKNIIKEEDLLGLELNSAKEKLKDYKWRTVKEDGVANIITSDLDFERYNLEIENNIIVEVYRG